MFLAKIDQLHQGRFHFVVMLNQYKRHQGTGDSYHHPERDFLRKFIGDINAFDGILRHHPEDVREALDIPNYIPVVVTDARNKAAVRDSMISLVRHAMSLAAATVG